MASKKTVPPKALTLQEKIEEAAQRDMDMHEYAIRNLPVPAIPLEVGQEVYLGRLENAVVAAVIDGGRRAVVKYPKRCPDNDTLARTHARFSSKKNSTWMGPAGARLPPGPDDEAAVEQDVLCVPAFDLQVKSNASTQDFSTPNFYVLNYSQRDVSGLMTMVTAFGLDMSPEYQRGLVWEESDKVKLIDSIFSQVDIGKFVFRKLPFKSEGPAYEIVDGKQRLNALLEFMSDRFAYKGKTWSQLSQNDRRYIDGYSISYAQLDEKYTRQQILELFVRLNTGGKPMDPSHLAKIAHLAAQEAPAPVPQPRVPGSRL